LPEGAPADDASVEMAQRDAADLAAATDRFEFAGAKVLVHGESSEYAVFDAARAASCVTNALAGAPVTCHATRRRNRIRVVARVIGFLDGARFTEFLGLAESGQGALAQRRDLPARASRVRECRASRFLTFAGGARQRAGARDGCGKQLDIVQGVARHRRPCQLRMQVCRAIAGGSGDARGSA